MGYKQVDIAEESAKNVKEILELFKPVEGETCFYFGHIRNGKTVLATSDILALLDRGEVVVANWKVEWPGYDEREHFWTVFYKTLFGRKNFYKYNRDNFIFVPPTDLRRRLPELAEMVNVHFFFDEAQWIMNSSERFNADDPESVAKMALILHNGHYCRSLNLISQRPTNIFRTMRSQINIWYMCEKVMSWPLLLFRKTTIEDMLADDLPDVNSEHNRKEIYWPSKRVLSAYNTHAMQGENAVQMTSDFEVYTATFFERVGNVMAFIPRLRRRRRTSTPTPSEVASPRRSIRDIKL